MWEIATREREIEINLGDLTEKGCPYAPDCCYPFKAWRKAHGFAHATEAATLKGSNRISKTDIFFGKSPHPEWRCIVDRI